MKLAKSGAIPKGSRVVVVSTAHGLKFVDFKLRYHQGQIPGGDVSFHNLPVDVASNVDAVRKVIDARLPS
jgi:threonine synthase